MGTLNDVIINKLSGGLGRRNPSQDMVSGLLFDGNAIAEDGTSGVAGLDQDKTYRLSSLEDAEALGINEGYDTNGQSAYYQIQQYFRLNSSGDLFIQATTGISYTEIVEKAKAFQESADGEIRQMGIIYSGVADFAASTAAAQVAQVQADEAYVDYMPFEVVLEGKGFGTVLSAGASTTPDLAELNASNVSIVVAMDVEAAKPVLQGGKGLSNSAAVGMTLGAISRAKVSENIAWVEQFNLSGAGFSKAGFVGGEEVKTQGDLETLNANRYVFARTHTGLSGVYFNDSHTATLGTSDFAYIENNRTINKAARLLRTALLPKLASPVLVNEAGLLAPSVTKGFETLCRAALEGMVSNQEVSVFDVFVDPSQDILATSQLRIKAEVTPVGTARKIIVDLGFKNPFGLGA
ncbi:DUF2586 family protein [Dokdonia sp.]|uniref:DUF2586 family protein n=1 Tax=Dokdonia sp. TaxID=2024995 RepID=UPI0032648CC8